MAITRVSNILSFGHGNQANKLKKPNYVKITGYGALASGVVSVLAIKNKMPKMHKEFAFLAGAFTFAHIAILEWYKHGHKFFKQK